MLKFTAKKYATTIVLKETPVGWNYRDEIVVAPTGFNNTEAERIHIRGCHANNTCTLYGPLFHEHFVGTHSVADGSTID
jgi:hypothetical protein